MKAYLKVENIICSHMDAGKDLNVPTNDWIPVSDRLPEDGEKLLCGTNIFGMENITACFKLMELGGNTMGIGVGM